MTVVAAVLGALAAWLLVGPAPPRLRRPAASGVRAQRWQAAAAVLAGAGAGVLWLDGRRLVLGLVLLGCLAALGDVLRRGRAARLAQARQAAVVELAEALAGELRAGQPLQPALERCVEVWAPFEAVAAAGRLGADVPGALRRLAQAPGAEGLARLATAWRVSADSGAGLAASLGQVAASARARQATRHLVAAELASAQATARLVAVLPLAVLAMSAGAGGRPWRFLLDTPAGLACLAVGAALAFAGLWWIDRIALAVLRR
jgi:tight adherence protein B